jgi:hypothetical protein
MEPEGSLPWLQEPTELCPEPGESSQTFNIPS